MLVLFSCITLVSDNRSCQPCAEKKEIESKGILLEIERIINELTLGLFISLGTELML